MKKNILVCGLISGVIITLCMIWSLGTYCSTGDFQNGMLFGYASMLLAFSMIFVAVKNYRDKDNNGIITFGKAFRIGLFITLICSTFYVVTWLIEYYYFIPDFFEKYSSHMLKQLKESGAGEAEILKQTKEMASYKDMYANPLVNALMTYMEILPVGLLISLISALILKRKTVTAY